MALLWLPLDEATIDAMRALAQSSWRPEDLDEAWELTGWPAPRGGSLSRLVFEEMEYTFGAGGRLVILAMRFEPDAINSFAAEFATFDDDIDGEDWADLVRGAEDWHTDRTATRARFDQVWTDGCAAVADRLGPPEVTGYHSADWKHTVWRLGDRLLAVAQGEDFSQGFGESAQLWVCEHSREAKIPVGEKLYELLCAT